MGFLSSVGKWFSKADNLKGVATAAVAAGGLYNDYMQSKYAKDMLKMSKADYNRGVAREDKMDRSLNDAYAASNLSKKKAKKPTGLVALG